MAIDEPPYQDSGNYVSDRKRFWPLRIPVSHWQLRHYLSNPENDKLYYASSREVYSLDTVTKKRKLIAVLPFDARCTASGHGWVCVGGEKEGHFAAIKLDGSGPRSQEVDAALNISALRGSIQSPSVRIERIGEEIVNSISVHRITDEDTHLDDVVAVLTNNDHTVRVYSLPQNRVTAVLSLPHAMNHATISNDGSMMVAVGDYNQAFFYVRQLKDSRPQIAKPHNRLTSASIEWTMIQVCELHATDPELTIGYFTTAWSPDGKFVAVGSEGGHITVFDVESLHDPEIDGNDAVVAIIPSSRPDLPIPYVGAVRSMMFSPAPWDLLIWAEDQGRICVGDLRTGLQQKQILELDPKEEGLEIVQVDTAVGGDAQADYQSSTRDLDELESDFLRRYGSMQDNATAVNFATEYVDARRRQRHQRTTSNDASRRSALLMTQEPRGLTAREHQILDSLRTSRQREEARVGGRSPSINYTSSDGLNTRITTGNNTTSNDDTTRNADDNSATPEVTGSSTSTDVATRTDSEIINTVHELFPELARSTAWSRGASSSYESDYLSPISVPGDALSWSNTRFNALSSEATISENSRMLDLRLPRRRASVVITPADSAASTTPAPTSPATATAGVERTVAMPQNGRLTPATSNDDRDEDQNPWRTIEDAMAAGSTLIESANRVPARTPLPAPPRNLDTRLATHVASEQTDRPDRLQTLTSQRERLRLSRREALTRLNGAALRTSTTTMRPLLDSGPETYEAASRHFAGHFAAGYGGPQIGVRTAGLAMSKDGKTLWVACEEGIFEFCMNRKGRMFWPSIVPR